jgi:hypothetical protein
MRTTIWTKATSFSTSTDKSSDIKHGGKITDAYLDCFRHHIHQPHLFSVHVRSAAQTVGIVTKHIASSASHHPRPRIASSARFTTTVQMRVFMYFAGLIVGTVIGALSVLIAGFFIDHRDR